MIDDVVKRLLFLVYSDDDEDDDVVVVIVVVVIVVGIVAIVLSDTHTHTHTRTHAQCASRSHFICDVKRFASQVFHCHEDNEGNEGRQDGHQQKHDKTSDYYKVYRVIDLVRDFDARARVDARARRQTSRTHTQRP